MNEIINQDQDREPEFDPDLAYNLDPLRVNKDGVIDGDALTAEIARDLKAIEAHIIDSDKQIKTLCIQINGASPEEEEDVISHIISEIQRLDPRIQDIEVRCETFQGDAQVMEAIGKELGKLGLKMDKNSTGLTRFELRPCSQNIRFQIHKKEKEEITKDEAEEIENLIKKNIIEAVSSWTPGIQLTLKIFSHKTHPMHQEDVEAIITQVFNTALDNLTAIYSNQDPSLIPNVKMKLEFIENMFSGEVDRITYESPKNIDGEQTNETNTK